MRHLRRFSVGFFLMLGVLSSSAVASAEPQFSDLDRGHWAYPMVSSLAGQGIVEGYPDRTFRPSNLVTYGEFIKLITTIVESSTDRSDALTKGKPIQEEADTATQWAMPFYQRGLHLGLYTRYDIGEGILNRPIPRGLMALLVTTALKGEETRKGEYDQVLQGIADVDTKTPYEYEIIKAYQYDVLHGYPDGRFHPENPLTRAEAAVVVAKVLNLWHEANPDAGNLPMNEEPSDPGVQVGSVMASEPEGTLTFTIRVSDGAAGNQWDELEMLLSNPLPDLALAMTKAFRSFAAHEPGPTGQGIRKEYFGDYPVLMERIDDTIRLFVFPKSYSSRTWNTEPGQVNEVFF